MTTPQAAFDAARKAMRGPLVRGQHDCLTSACAASLTLYGRDPLARGLPEYDSLTAALRILREHGGWLAWADEAFTAAGMVRVEEARPGDLGVIQRGAGGGTFGIAIRPTEWVVKATHDFAVVKAEAMGVWRWV